jgi:hypothetical protein
MTGSRAFRPLFDGRPQPRHPHWIFTDMMHVRTKAEIDGAPIKLKEEKREVEVDLCPSSPTQFATK